VATGKWNSDGRRETEGKPAGARSEPAGAARMGGEGVGSIDFSASFPRSIDMQTYILLVNFTDQGMRNIKDTIKRAHAFEDMAKKSGALLKVLWPLRCDRGVRGARR
jgi:hypothetical protein